MNADANAPLVNPAAGRVFDIPAAVPFLAALARGIWNDAGGDPLRLSRAIVLLPTRRACRAIGDEFLRLADGRPTLLPRLRPLGDVDEDIMPSDGATIDHGDLPPSIGELRRKLVLARAILGQSDRPVAQAIELAGELGRLIDQAETERVGFDGLATLVPDRFAEHWRQTLEFLALVTRHWPDILAGEGAIGAAERRNRLLAALAQQWSAASPPVPVYAAGSTGSIPATADLLAVVATLPTGSVILPGLDRHLDDDAWNAIDETHAQFGLARLLERFGLARRDVVPWPHVPSLSGALLARGRLVSEVMRPASTSDAWRRLPAFPVDVLAGVARVDCANPQDEAATIALMMRDALERADRTAALVTPDRALARRVAAELGRYGIAIDDSAGRPLVETPAAVFMRLIAEMAEQGVTPVPLLACFKHPLAAGGRSVANFRALARHLETAVLRGPRTGNGFAGLRESLTETKDRAALFNWLLDLEAMFAPFLNLLRDKVPPADLLRGHVGLAEALAASDSETGAQRLWAQETGEALAEFVDDLAGASADFPPIDGGAYAKVFVSCLAGRVVRPRYGRHPRLQILGPLEARFIAADLTIVGGLNEGTWPPQPVPDPWLSRPMRTDFGLPGLERRIGLSAHDFAQALGGEAVVLTRASRVDGVPTVPSRWLLRLDAVLKAADGSLPAPETPRVAAWRTRLDAEPRLPPVAPPAPCPPLAARPRKLSVTAIETWMRDPYAIYARYVLKLNALDAIDADPNAADQGMFIHHALDRFVRAFPGELPNEAFDRLLQFGREQFGSALARPSVKAFWWPKFEAIARWFIRNEAERRTFARPIASECSGGIDIAAPGGPFKLTAKVDRIDRLAAGGIAIIDYKTGRVPSEKMVQAGYAAQLPLEAVIATHGGFRDVGPEIVASLAHWRLSGRDPAGEICPLASDDPAALTALADAARIGLEQLIARFDQADTPYLARPRPQFAPDYSDYEHLARVMEWADEDGQ